MKFQTPTLGLDQIARRSVYGIAICCLALVGQYSITFGTQVVISRLLTPSDFGRFAKVALVAGFLNQVVNWYGERYLIQQRTITPDRLNAVFTLELYIALLAVATACLLAMVSQPAIGEGMESVLVILALGCLTIPFLKYRAILEKDILFAKSRTATVLAQCVGCTLAIAMAAQGWGIWSLVGWRLGTQCGEAAMTVWLTRMAPRLNFDVTLNKEVVTYGKPLVGSSILVFFYWNVDYYIVGLFLGDVNLGYYFLAFQISHYFLTVRSALNAVLFTAFSNMPQANQGGALRILMDVTGLIYTVPVAIVWISGPELVSYVLGSKWEQSHAPLKVFTIVILMRALSGCYTPFLHSQGSTNPELKMALINAVAIPVTVSAFTLWWGMTGAASGVLISSCVTMIFGWRKFVRTRVEFELLAVLWKPAQIVILILLVRIAGFSHAESILIFLVNYFVVYRKTFAHLLRCLCRWI